MHKSLWIVLSLECPLTCGIAPVEAEPRRGAQACDFQVWPEALPK